MNRLAYFMAIFFALLMSAGVSAQPGHGIPKQSKINIPKVINPPQVKIHANSNSVFRVPNTRHDLNKKNQPKKDDIKKENVDRYVKQKNGKKQKK